MNLSDTREVYFRNQRICAWTGPALCVLFFIGFWVIAGFMPPPDPNATGVEIARIYQANTTGIRIGLIIGMTAIGFLAFWATAISAQMRRMEGPRYPGLANAQLVFAGISCLTFIFPMMCWVTASFRPTDRDPELMRLLSDLGWMPFVMVVYTGVPWVCTMGLAILSDRRDKPVFPRWAGFYCIWLALIWQAASLAVFIKHGPFAWNGIVTFWMPIVAFATFLVIVSVLLLRAIREQEAEEIEAERRGADTLTSASFAKPAGA